MRKWIIAGIAALVVGYGGLLPFEQMDAGELVVVETLFVESEDGNVTLTAAGNRGTGQDMETAKQALEVNTPGQLFLRQAKRIVFCGGAEDRIQMQDLPEEVPVGVVVYYSNLPAEYLSRQTDRLEAVLDAREKRQEELTKLADLENARLNGEKRKPEWLNWEAEGEGEE